MKIMHNAAEKQITYLDERFYTNDGVSFFPSVTTILEVYPKGYGFTQWLKDLGQNADEVVKRAAETGSRVHDAIDQYINGNELRLANDDGTQIYSFEEWQMILKFVEFYTTYKPETIKNEESLCSETLGFGGTLDWVCKIDGQIWLIDFKTANAIHTSYELQLSAYQELWNIFHTEQPIQRRGVLHLKAFTRGADKTGKVMQGKGWIVKEFERDQESAFRLFEHAHAIWTEENPNYKPKNMIYPDRVKRDNVETGETA